MELLVRNADGNVPQKERDYAAKKLGKLDKFFNKATKVEMVHHEQKGKHRLEVTVFADEFTIRGEERDVSLQACIDRVSEKLEKRLRNLKSRLVDSHRRRGTKSLPKELVSAPTKKTIATKIERSQFMVKHMAIEEATLQLELSGQPFYVFREESSGDFSVLFKKKNGSYGLLEPES